MVNKYRINPPLLGVNSIRSRGIEELCVAVDASFIGGAKTNDYHATSAVCVELNFEKSVSILIGPSSCRFHPGAGGHACAASSLVSLFSCRFGPACGGLFCNANTPESGAERILFSPTENGLRHVRISYQATHASDVLPVPQDVDYGLSSEMLFTQFDNNDLVSIYAPNSIRTVKISFLLGEQVLHRPRKKPIYRATLTLGFRTGSRGGWPLRLGGPQTVEDLLPV